MSITQGASVYGFKDAFSCANTECILAQSSQAEVLYGAVGQCSVFDAVIVPGFGNKASGYAAPVLLLQMIVCSGFVSFYCWETLYYVQLFIKRLVFTVIGNPSIALVYWELFFSMASKLLFILKLPYLTL